MNRVPYSVIARWALLSVVALGLMLAALWVIWVILGRPTGIVISR